MIDPCTIAVLRIDGSPNIVSTSSIDYIVGFTKATIPINLAWITSSETTFTCPPYLLEFFDGGSPINSGVVFTYNDVTSEFETFTDDRLQVSVHSMTVRVSYVGYTNYSDPLPFTVNILDPCSTDNFAFLSSITDTYY